MTNDFSQWAPCDAPPDQSAMTWHVPPVAQGQMVEYSYAMCGDDWVYARVHNRSDEVITYQRREIGGGELFEPWNVEPI